MPLIKSMTPKAFKQNIKTEVKTGKPVKQAVAIAYSEAREAQKAAAKKPAPKGKKMSLGGWIGVDLDGTLAHYGGWVGPEHIGEPIPEMLERVKKWLNDGRTVKIFTARCCVREQVPPIQAWLEKHGIGGLEITNVKDFKMIELWDDRCVRVIPNTGKPCCHI